jgi:hypothetical protein
MIVGSRDASGGNDIAGTEKQAQMGDRIILAVDFM